MKPVFLDSVGLVALWNKRDQWHEAAIAAYNALREERAVYVSTAYVIAECANALARVPSRRHLAKLVQGLSETGGLVFPTEVEWRSAWSDYVEGHQGSPGLVDLLSIAVMRRLRLSRVFTNDRHFADAGMVPLF